MFGNAEKLNVFVIGVITVVIVSAVFFLDTRFKNDKKKSNPGMDTGSEHSAKVSPGGPSNERIAVYRWVDAGGTIHYSDRPGLNKNQASKIVYSEQNINITHMPKTGISPTNTKPQKLPNSAAIIDKVTNNYEAICSGFKKYSIDYRNCRSSEKKALKKGCFSLRKQLNQAVSEKYQALKRSEKRVCLAYERYTIID